MNNGKILVMDDENEIRYIFTKMLNRMQYEVETAVDGYKALELFKSAIEIKKPFEAVIIDLEVANGMGGEETIRRLLEIDPGTKIILSSGSISDHIMNDFKKYGIRAVLRKPFKNDELKKVLRKVISE
ncbi:MAG: response regulator [Candidatus Scalindua sp.]|jgi:CheY-like chemotaxis protein|nr:response regulator [Candidatus Scalindua sp.]